MRDDRHEEPFGRLPAVPPPDWFHSRFPVVLMLLLGITLTLVAAAVTRDAERSRLRMEFRRIAEDRIGAVRATIEGHVDALHSVAALFRASEVVERDEFRRFTAGLLERNEGVQALEWVPRVPRAERESREQAARDEGFADFRFVELGPLSSLRPVQERAEYFPVYFVEPYEGNERALGFDLASNPARLEGIRQALATGRASGTARMFLVQDIDTQFGVLLLVPLSSKRDPTHFDGLALGVFRLGDLLRVALAYLDAVDVDLTLTDLAASPSEAFLARTVTPASVGDPGRYPSISDDFRHAVTIDFGGRAWRITCQPMIDSPFLGTPPLPFVVLGAGLLVTLLLVTHLNRSRRAAESLREEKTFSETLIASLPGIFYLIDEQGWIVRWNRNLEDVLGYTSRELGAMQWDDLVVPEDRQRLVAMLRELRSVGGTSTEGTLLAKNGRRIPFTMTGRVTRIGTDACLVGMGIDVSARREAEDKARRHEAELAHVSRVVTMGELAASLAHEINQPLCAIVLNAQSALRLHGSGRASTDDMRDALVDVVKDGERAGEVIRHLRDFLRKGGINREPLDINQVVLDVDGIVNGNAVLAGATLFRDLPAGLPPVRGDRVQLQQVLLNLIRNGVDAMEGQEPDTRRLSIRTSAEDPAAVTVSVSDHGPGFPPGSQDRLFEPFYSTKPEGLGVGLSISRTIVEAHGGRMWASPNPEGGAVVRFTIPIDRSRAEAHG